MLPERSETARELVDDALGYLDLDEYDGPELIDLGEYPATDLVALRDAVKHIESAARRVRTAVEREIADRLVDNDLRIGDRLFRYTSDVKETIVDPKALAEFLGDDWGAVVPLTASTSIRKTGLDAVAERRGLDPDTVRETFLAKTFGEPKLKEVPLDKAPKFAQTMKDGELRPRRRTPKQLDN